MICCFLVVMSVLLTGCEGYGGDSKPMQCQKNQIPVQYMSNQTPVQYPENQWPFDCRVVIFVPEYVGSVSRPSVDIYWDGQKLFSGKLPAQDFGIGSPVALIRIRTNPGTHALEVVSEGRSMQHEFVLNNSGERGLLLSRFPDGKGFLIEDLGYNVRFQ